MAIKKKSLIIFIMLTMIFAGCINIKDNSKEQEDISQEQEPIRIVRIINTDEIRT